MNGHRLTHGRNRTSLPCLAANFLTRPIITGALRDSFAKLDPRIQFRNPVMFVVYVGSILTTIIGIAAALGAASEAGRPGFVLHVSAWLWLTVLFANFAEAVAEGRGKAQAATLRAMRRHVHAKRILGKDRHEHRPSKRARSSAATWCWSRPTTPFPRTVKWSKAWPRSMKAP